MIFRWSIWGSHKTKNIELLKYSILTFKRYFGFDHEYVVCTDDVNLLKKMVGNLSTFVDFSENGKSFYDVESKATWKKWCPRVRLDINQTEIYVDSDVFLLKYPIEIDSFLSNLSMKFSIMDEFFGQSWQHGAMSRKASQDTPFVNAGFFVQKAGYDISPDLLKEFEWWQKNVKKDEQTWHDEQGALAVALTQYFKNGELYVLPKDKYILIGENENTDIENLDGIVLLHAVYPDHPAFYKFKNYLDKIIL